jgi:mannose-1-phosphate guanylyltransferase/mannose-1-phosphate guanylyltransferase/mannose-6-phosphate isomerase
LGVTPDKPETGYGYIRTDPGRSAPLCANVLNVAAFVEKPNLQTAQQYLSEGGYYWNAGMFVLKASVWLKALEQFRPDILQATQQAWAARTADTNTSTPFIRPGKAEFAAIPAESIDYAVMEKAERVAVVPVAMGWSDVGSWDALHSLGSDANGDAHSASNGGDVIALDTSNCLLRSDGIRIAAVGVHDLIVVASGNDVLILPRGQSQDVKRIVEAMKAKKNA